MLAKSQRRKPIPGGSEQTFLDALEEGGVEVGEYHLPDWSDRKESLLSCLDSLFKVPPPTALIIQEAPVIAAVQQFLTNRGLKVPDDVSLICSDPDPTFACCEQTNALMTWRSRPIVRRIIRWADKISRGKQDLVKSFANAEFIEGGSLGGAKD